MGQRIPPPHPTFSMKGRNPMSLINHSNEWHYHRQRQNRALGQLAKGKSDVNFFWGGVGINDCEFKRGKNSMYEIIQLKSFFDLRDEGNSMRHCVATYATSCNTGKCSIFSVREYQFGVFVGRTATIEVRGREIVQVRGKMNRKPDDTTISIINDWSSNERLSLSKYAL